MASWLSLAIFAVSAIVAVTEARAIPAEPDLVSLMMDSYGNPVLFLREKRTPVNTYPHRAMMFTGYYRPVRRANEGQATGVFAQGNAVSGGAYLGDGQPNYLPRGPEPAEDADVSSAEAEAAPNPLEHHVDEEEQNYPAQEEQHDQPDSQPAQEEDQEPTAYATEPPVAEEPTVENAPSVNRPSKKQGPKKSKKTPIQFESEENDEDESEDSDVDDDDEPAVPFIPFKSNRRRQGNIPNLNNFFPMVFSFPRSSGRGGSSSSGSPPGMITAIANSYSTAKGGVASSVATAYGGSPPSKKQRRAQPAQE